jgi:hypothetical protein
MPAVEPYVDASPLAKRSIDEAGSDEIDVFLDRWPRVLISRLVVLEFRCVLQGGGAPPKSTRRTSGRLWLTLPPTFAAGTFRSSH